MSTHDKFCLCQVVFLVLLILLISPIASKAAIIHYMELSQLSFVFPDVGEPVPNSMIGEVNLASMPGRIRST